MCGGGIRSVPILAPLSLDDGVTMLLIRTALVCVVLLSGLAVASGQQGDQDHLLIYFDEFSANLTTQAKTIIAEAAKRAGDEKASKVRIEARASATGSQLANHYLALTRSQVVADELAKLGVNPEIVQQVALGQSGSDDPSVAERRVDIVIQR